MTATRCEFMFVAALLASATMIAQQCSARKEGLMFKTVFAATAALVITVIPAQAQTCTRDGLKAIVANYFKAVETHNMSALETAPNLRITQNGSEIKLGEGFFKTGGKSQFQRTLIDTERCGTLTQAVIDETPDPTRRHPPDEEEEHAEQQVRAVRRLVPLDREEERRVAAVPLRGSGRSPSRWARWCACRCARWRASCGR